MGGFLRRARGKINLKTRFYFLAGAILIFADQAAKYFAYAGKFGGFLNYGKPAISEKILPNYNFAFGIAAPKLLGYAAYGLIALFALRWFLKQKQKSELLKISFTLIAAGAVSNIIDRVALGYVRDFIYVFWGNVINFADIFITAGVILLLFAA